MINFDGDTRPYGGDFKLITNENNLGITEEDTFPIYAKVNWITDTIKGCNHIVVTSFEILHH